MEQGKKILIFFGVFFVLLLIGFFFVWSVLLPYYQVLESEGERHAIYSQEYGLAIQWIKENTKEDATILAWWDYGEFIEEETGRQAYLEGAADDPMIKKTVGECYSLPLQTRLIKDPFKLFLCNGLLSSLTGTDFTGEPQKIFETARLFTSFPGDDYETDLQEMGIDYVFITRSDMVQKFDAVLFLSNRTCISNQELKEKGMEFPELESLTSRYWLCGKASQDTTSAGKIGMASCQANDLAMGEGSLGGNVECDMFSDQPLVLTSEEWEGVQNATWPGYDLKVSMGGQPMKFKVYGQPDNKIMYFYATYYDNQGRRRSRVLSDAPVNHMLASRLFLGDSSLPGLEIVYSDENAVIYEVTG